MKLSRSEFLQLVAGAVPWLLSSTAQPQMFSAAESYERFMGRWSRSLAPLLVKFTGVRNGDAVLDVGSGTGALAAAIAAAAPRSRIVGIDPSDTYVAFAQSKHGRNLVRFEVGDAQAMTFGNATFDRAMSLLVMNFIPDPGKALNEMVRVSKPGGIISAAVWDYGDGMEMLRVFWDEAIALNPPLEARDERHMPLCRKGELAALWQKHGLKAVVEEPLTIETRFSSFHDYWMPFLEKQGPAGAFVAALPEPDQERLRVRLQRRLVGDKLDAAVTLRARAWAVRGTAPGL